MVLQPFTSTSMLLQQSLRSTPSNYKDYRLHMKWSCSHVRLDTPTVFTFCSYVNQSPSLVEQDFSNSSSQEEQHLRTQKLQ